MRVVHRSILLAFVRFLFVLLVDDLSDGRRGRRSLSGI